MKNEITGKFIEAVDKQGTVWLVLIIQAGVSKNKNFYSEEVLKQAVTDNLFEGVRSFARTDNEHVANTNESVKNVVGWFDNISYSTKHNGVIGHFHITKDSEWLKLKMLSAFESEKYDLFGFSIVGNMQGFQEPVENYFINRITNIISIDSIDPVVYPSAGGGIIDIVESSLTNLKDKTMKENPNENKNIAETKNVSESENLSENKSNAVNVIEINNAIVNLKLTESRILLNEKLQASTLPDPIKLKLKKTLDNQILSEAQIMEHINAEQDTYAKVYESFNKPNAESLSNIKIGETNVEKLQKGLDDFFFQGARLTSDEIKSGLKSNSGFKSIKEAYIQFTNDTEVTGKIKNIRLSEAIDTSTFTNALANSLTKRMVRDYNMMELDTWKQFCDIVPISDFKTQERIRMGGYGNLPSVSQSAAYQSLTSPADEKATYSVTKYGGTETLTLEAIKNDDIYALRKIPVNLARAAAQTLHEHVYGWFKNNSTIYDSKAFFHADHSNTGTTALDSTALNNARLAMKKQTALSSSKPIGIRAKYLLVPSDLELLSYNLTRLGYGQYNDVPSFIQEQHILPISVAYWTDVNNWYLVADPHDCPVIEVGFLDGKEEPELFIQDMPNVGSIFTNDIITFKIRHIYSSTVVDYRGAYGSIVAG